MANIVTTSNSVHGILNVAHSMKELEGQGRKVGYKLIDEKAKDQFWQNILQYVDPNDKTLVVLDVPHPELDVIQKMELQPWQAAIVYIPTEFNAPNKEEKDLMLAKGISVSPVRKPSEAFLGDIEDVEQPWLDLAKVLTMEKTQGLDSDEIQKAKGAFQDISESPKRAIEMIIRNDYEGLVKVRQKPIRPDAITKTPAGCLMIEYKRFSRESTSDIFEQFLNNMTDVVYKQGEKRGVLSIKPTLFKYFAKDPEPGPRFGKAAIVWFKGEADWDKARALCAFTQQYWLKLDDPKEMTWKTLERRLIGGITTETIGGKTYEKHYKSLHDSFLELKIVDHDILEVPGIAFENTVALLHEAGSRYRVLAPLQ